LLQHGCVYLDVRSVEEFELGHPEGAFNIPWHVRDPADVNPRFAALASEAFQRTETLIVGCHTGKRSAPACAALVDAGFTHVLEQSAGFAGRRDAFGKLVEPGWERAGLPTSTCARPGRSYRELCDKRPGSER
jgi:rhodanese-related sulfurtransferase